MREAVEVVEEIGADLVWAAEQALEGEGGRVVKRLPGGRAQETVRVHDSVRAPIRVRPDVVFRLDQERIEAADDRHGQDHVAAFAAHEDIAEDVGGDPPDEADDPAVLSLLHREGLRLRPH